MQRFKLDKNTPKEKIKQELQSTLEEIKKVGKKANIENKNYHDFSSHMLRHSHVSLLTELGVPIKTIMERVGHKDEKTTLQIYTHVTKKMKEDVDEKLNNLEL